MLTLFAIAGDDIFNPERAIESFGDIVEKSVILDHRRIDNLVPVDTPWYGYVYADEWVDERIREALPVFLQADYFDCLVMLKKQLNYGDTRVFQSPRIFKKDVTLEKDMLIPRNPTTLVFETMLDGWVRGHDGL